MRISFLVPDLFLFTSRKWNIVESDRQVISLQRKGLVIKEVSTYIHLSKAALVKEDTWIFAALRSNIASQLNADGLIDGLMPDTQLLYLTIVFFMNCWLSFSPHDQLLATKSSGIKSSSYALMAMDSTIPQQKILSKYTSDCSVKHCN